MVTDSTTIPSSNSFDAEVRRWRKKSADVNPVHIPTNVSETLEVINSKSYPNICRILRILLVIPVTTANVERANLTLNYIKTGLRSTMSETKLNALVLLYVLKDIPLHLPSISDRFAVQHPRTMMLSDLTTETTSYSN